ncbi:LOW QUALITY PROTEIN: transcription initiation factor TFIID subunit 15b [Camellia sinensis]|uniref:LOW QUALITY PROTEIN: transcription initiation factor TFIID subunit 15b n=1 Tax=Camellia sinensis TaxID=4442 RepID=UPI0010358CA6|nr:LOW QUALITY PROTEIN: transcription initiation factor TFIID subunit 15b [Camellia sinensis]
MGTREKDQTTPHQPLLSSLVVRPSDSGGGGAGGGSDYEPGEVRRDPPPYSRSDRFSDNPGYRIRAGSGSPVRRRNADHRYSPDFDHPGGHHRNRGYGSMRSPGRYRDYSPPYGRGRGGGGRFMNRGFDGPGFGPGAFRGEGMPRNNPNVRPREGDWICPDPLCNNLNFARREYCNNCNKSRYAPGGSPPPRRGYPGPPPPHGPPRRFPGPPLDRPSGRSMNGYRSSPRGWARDGPREFGAGGPPHPRYDGGRFTDHQMRRDRLDYPEEDYRERSKFDRPMPPLDWGNKDRGGRDNFFNERKGFERRPPSPPLPPPPLPPPRGRWAHDVRDRSRSPIRGGGPAPSKDYRRDMYMEQGRDERRGGMGRDRIGDAY